MRRLAASMLWLLLCLWMLASSDSRAAEMEQGSIGCKLGLGDLPGYLRVTYGYFFDALRRRIPGKISVVITALAFSLFHFQPQHILPLFGGGLVLGWARLKTDSLRLPVLIHVVNNALVFLLVV